MELPGGMEMGFLNQNGFGSLKTNKWAQLDQVGGHMRNNGSDDATASGAHDLGATVHAAHAKGHHRHLEREAPE